VPEPVPDIQNVRVEIVPVAAVLPHEIADPGRERRIEWRLRTEEVLRDPVIVGSVPDLEEYVLLDGTNRLLALQHLGLPWVMAQVLDYSDQRGVQLRTWCHAAAAPIDTLVSGARSIASVEVEELPPLGATDALDEHETLAVLLDGHRRYVARRAAGGPSRSQQLRQLVDRYEDRMQREDCDPDDVEDRAKRLCQASEATTLLAFPPFSRSQVVAIAMQREPIPAGITRHVLLKGRALRVNLPLEVLGRSMLEEARGALRAHMEGLQPRLYREPTVLFDS
jgi:hypothetical protein